MEPLHLRYFIFFLLQQQEIGERSTKPSSTAPLLYHHLLLPEPQLFTPRLWGACCSIRARPSSRAVVLTRGDSKRMASTDLFSPPPLFILGSRYKY